MADCKCKKTECEECPEWIFTFADLVMLMMGFFVILWVLKPNPNLQKANPESNDDWLNVAAEVRKAFGYEPNPHSKDPVDLRMILRKLHTVSPTKGPTPSSEAREVSQGPKGIDHAVTDIRDGKHTVIGGRILFDRGSVELTADIRKSLDQISDKIRGHFNIVLIKGHSALDDLGDTATPAQQMEFSVTRAQAAADYLISKGVDPQVLRVQGCSTYEPVNQRAYTAEAQAANRRVEVEVTSTLVSDRQGKRSKAQPASAPAKDTTSERSPAAQEK